MDRLAAILAQNVDIETLSAEDLAAYREDLVAAAKEAHSAGVTPEVAALIKTAAGAVTACRAEEAGRAEQAAQVMAEADDALAELDGAPVEAADAAEVEAEPVAASARGGYVRTVKTPRSSRPRSGRATGARLTGRDGTIELRSLADVANEIAVGAQSAKQRLHNDGEKLSVLTFGWADRYDSAELIRHGDSRGNTDKLYEAAERAIDQTRAMVASAGYETMVASGGAPGPGEPRYTELTFGLADRPVRDGLPRLPSERGILVWNPPPTLDDVIVNNTGGAITTVTSAQDVSGTTKTVQEPANPNQSTATVRAIARRLQFGNMADRFLPERAASWQKLALVAQAREAERSVLVDIKAGSTKYTDTPAKFGAFRDLKAQVLGLVEEIHDHLRDDSIPIRAIFPDFLPAMLAVDVMRQQPGDDAWNVTAAQMRLAIASWGVAPIFADDSIRGRLLTSPTGQSPRTPGFDADVEWCLYPEGTWVFLDGGTLDLGIIRDSVTSATNKMQTFAESFEAVAQLSSFSYWCTSSLCADGASQAATNVAVCSPQNS